MNTNFFGTVLLTVLIAFLFYRRFKRTFGRQPFRPKRMKARLVLLLVICIVSLVAYFSVPALFAAAAGALTGSILAVFGLKHTRYEITAEGRFYVPNRWIGLFVSALFLGRLAARMITIYSAVANGVATNPNGVGTLQKSPVTLGIFFVLASYYIVYYAGILRREHQDSVVS